MPRSNELSHETPRNAQKKRSLTIIALPNPQHAETRNESHISNIHIQPLFSSNVIFYAIIQQTIEAPRKRKNDMKTIHLGEQKPFYQEKVIKAGFNASGNKRCETVTVHMGKI